MTEQTLSYERYLAELPAERRVEVERVWRVVRKNMPEGYAEKITPKYLTYMADEDWYMALANQKNYISIYLMPLYLYPELKAKLDASAPNLKCGKGCINFKRADELPLETIGEIIAAHGVKEYKQHCAEVRDRARSERKSGKGKSKK
jgi:uncharacterized protein YdhG (YjbR/CyaY superfamily)